VPPQFADVQVQGITDLDAADVAFAERWGYRVKLLGIAKRRGNRAGAARCTPLLSADHLLAQVHGSMNAVMVKSDAAGITLYYGAGAGLSKPAPPSLPIWWTWPAAPACHRRCACPRSVFRAVHCRRCRWWLADDVPSAFYVRLDLSRPDATVPRVLQALALAACEGAAHGGTAPPG